jgi:hypothetical protein
MYVGVNALDPLLNSGMFLQTHYLKTAVIYLIISQSLPSKGTTCHSIVIFWVFTPCNPVGGYKL